MENNATKQTKGALFQWDGKPSLSELLPMSLQHLFAMIVGNITPALIIARSANLADGDRVVLVQASLLISAITTLIMVLSIKGFFGARLPVIMGVSFSYIPTMIGIAKEFDVATIFGAQIVGAIFAVLFGMVIKYAVPLFPPIVTGTVVLSIGLSLYPIAINYMAGGLGSENFGSYKNWAIAMVTFIIVLILNNYTKGLLKLSSILIGMIIGYFVAIPFGLVNFAKVGAASWFQMATPLHFGLKFEVSTMIAMAIMFIVNSVQAIGDLSATTVGGMDRMPTDSELSNGIMGYGLCNILGAVLGGLPTATYSQNVGIVSTTKVINKWVYVLTGGILFVAAVIPKLSAVLTTIPAAVLGGATISVFAIISMNGIRLITRDGFTGRDATIVGIALAFGLGITQASGAIASFPMWFNTIFGRSAVVIATLVAIGLNLLLPREKK